MNEKDKAGLLLKFRKVAKAGHEIISSVKGQYEGSAAKTRVDEASAQVKQFLDEKGISQKAAQVGSTVTDHFDTISGQKLLALVQGRLEIQMQYNNILATKLEEALSRISALEQNANVRQKAG